jgi:5-(hydroxymethyl)furfural/furfural oxidase
MMLLVVNKSSWHAVGAAIGGIGVTLTSPQSRGTVRLISSHPAALPDVRFRMLTQQHDFERMDNGLQLALELMQDPDVRPLRHELFAAGYSGIVRRLNRPGVTTQVVTRALEAVLDSAGPIRHLVLKYGIAAGDVDEDRMRSRGWLEGTVRRHGFGTSTRPGPAAWAARTTPARSSTAIAPSMGSMG